MELKDGREVIVFSRTRCQKSATAQQPCFYRYFLLRRAGVCRHAESGPNRRFGMRIFVSEAFRMIRNG